MHGRVGELYNHLAALEDRATHLQDQIVALKEGQRDRWRR
jgi:hypothetical protein